MTRKHFRRHPLIPDGLARGSRHSLIYNSHKIVNIALDIHLRTLAEYYNFIIQGQKVLLKYSLQVMTSNKSRIIL